MLRDTRFAIKLTRHFQHLRMQGPPAAFDLWLAFNLLGFGAILVLCALALATSSKVLEPALRGGVIAGLVGFGLLLLIAGVRLARLRFQWPAAGEQGSARQR